MKSILISIKPKWVAKILNGEKTIEIRKTMPKCDLPITVYIYCTKWSDNGYTNTLTRMKNGSFHNLKKFDEFTDEFIQNIDETGFTGKVVAKFTLNKVEEIGMWNYSEYGTRTLCENHLSIKSCLDAYELKDYLKGKIGYAIHISDLEIFDKPKELSEFYKAGAWKVYEEQLDSSYMKRTEQEIMKSLNQTLTKAPQSWCYVEV